MKTMTTVNGRKRWVAVGFLVLVVALVGALMLTACGDGGNGPSGPSTVEYGYPSTGLGGHMGIDPQSTTAGIVGVHTAETLHGTPGLAESWELAPNITYIDYVIRDGIKFHNGDEMTVEDVKFSWDRCFNSSLVGTGLTQVMNRFIDHVEIIDDDEVRVYLKEWTMSLLESSPVIVPKNHIEEVGWEAWANSPVLTGPFKIKFWTRDVSVWYEQAFAEEGHWYWGTDTPNYDELIIHSVVEPTTRLAMLKTGELDAAHVPTTLIPDVESDPDLTLVTSEYSRCWNIIFYDMINVGVNASPLLDPDVRRAVSLAINREDIAENVFHGAYEPWGSYWSPNILGYRENAPDPYNPTEAISLLDTAGYPDGFETVFSYPQGEDTASAAVISCLDDVGITATAQPYEPVMWGTMKWNGEHTGMGYLHIPWWGGSYYPDSIFGGEIYDWGPGAVDIPVEIWDAFDELTNATTVGALEEAAWAAEDAYFEAGYKIPVWAIHAALAYGPTVESWNPGWPDDGYTVNLINLQYKE